MSSDEREQSREDAIVLDKPDEFNIIERTNYDERLKTLKQVRRWVRTRRTKVRNELEHDMITGLSASLDARYKGRRDEIDILHDYVEGLIREMVDE